MFPRLGFMVARWGAFARGRNFEKGALKYLILDLLKDKPSHGYEVMRALEERSHGMYSPSAGSVYPTLQLLSDMGYVTASEADAKKIYTITDSGRAYLKENQGTIDRINAFIAERWPAAGKHAEWRQTFQEMHKLGNELRGRFHELDKDQLSAIRGVVEKAIKDIEKIIENREKPETPASPKP
jgi:DNA-binding PadR family transcriptional regulator